MERQLPHAEGRKGISSWQSERKLIVAGVRDECKEISEEGNGPHSIMSNCANGITVKLNIYR